MHSNYPGIKLEQNRRSALSLAWHKWFSNKGKEWKIYYNELALSSETQIWKFHVDVCQTAPKHCTKKRAARAARLFVFIQIIDFSQHAQKRIQTSQLPPIKICLIVSFKLQLPSFKTNRHSLYTTTINVSLKLRFTLKTPSLFLHKKNIFILRDSFPHNS